jgi:hypothetical protein
MVVHRRPGWTTLELEVLGHVAGQVAERDIIGDHGITEEGDPWFVLEQPDGSALVHFAKIDGRYVSAPSQAGAFDANERLLPLIRRFLERNKKPA